MLIGLVLKYGQGAAIAALVLFGVATCRQRDAALVARGVALEQARLDSLALDSLTKVADSLHARVRVDTLRLTQTVTQLRTLRDTINIRDTVQVIEYIARCDSVASACQRAVNALTAAIQVDSARWATERSLLLNRLDAGKTGFISRWLSCGPGYGITHTGEPRFYAGCQVDVWP